MVKDLDGNYYCNIECEIQCYRELLDAATKCFEQTKELCTQRIAELEAKR